MKIVKQRAGPLWKRGYQTLRLLLLTSIGTKDGSSDTCQETSLMAQRRDEGACLDEGDGRAGGRFWIQFEDSTIKLCSSCVCEREK